MREYLPLVSGLVGAIIGSLSSILTLVIQAHYQQKREFKKMAIQYAMEDFKFRIVNESDRIQPAAAPIVIGYWDKMIDLVVNDKLSPKTMREVIEYDAALKRALSTAYKEWKKEYAKSTDARNRGG